MENKQRLFGIKFPEILEIKGKGKGKGKKSEVF